MTSERKPTRDDKPTAREFALDLEFTAEEVEFVSEALGLLMNGADVWASPTRRPMLERFLRKLNAKKPKEGA